MQPVSSSILTMNGGSSSIKFSLYDTDASFSRQLYGKINRIGLPDPILSYTPGDSGGPVSSPVRAGDLQEAAGSLLDWLESQHVFEKVGAIGHRVVYGLQRTQPSVVDDVLIKELKGISDYDPDHLPGEILLMELLQKRFSHLPQVACFDTSFHTDIPRIGRLLPIPGRYEQAGIRRYGFHGLSYAYIMEELDRVGGKDAAEGRVIIVHLGSGASMAAVNKGKCVDTSMGFTPAGGFMMGTRPGDLDPGVAWQIIRQDKLSVKAFNELINHQCGLLGVSGSSSDVQDLLRLEPTDTRAAEAIALFCYQVKKWIGAFTTVLSGLDTLIFTGGIGENAVVIRQRICQGLEYLGIGLQDDRNKDHGPLISSDESRIRVYVLATNEEKMIAQTTGRLLQLIK